LTTPSERKIGISRFLSHPFWSIEAISDEALKAYDQALTHDSFVKEQKDRGMACEHYERLEFLGDRILNQAVAEFLFRHYSDADEGTLSNKIKVAKNKNLAAVVKSHELGIQSPLVRLGKGQHLEDSIIADVFEALIAAIYLDPAYGMAKVHHIVQTSLAQDIVNFDPAEDYVSRLNEYVQGKFQKDCDLSKDEFAYVKTDHTPTPSSNRHAYQVEVRILNQVCGQGSGSNLKAAKQAAAREALGRISAGYDPFRR
jgi:ribonuclease-3